MIGLGNVGQGFLKILADDSPAINASHDVSITVVGISDLRLGNYYTPQGFNPAALLKAIESGKLESLSEFKTTWSTEEWIERCEAEFLLEASFTNFTDAEPAISYCRAALKHGKHVVTSNKGPIALYYTELNALARQHNLRLGVEGTVMSGTPSMALGMDLLKAADISRVQGILNGTTNYILTRMEEGNSYEAALAEAQKLGYAEADPTGDVEGFDAAGKVVILGNLVLGAPLTFADVDRKGISGITLDDVESAKKDGKRWKLLGMLEKNGDKVSARVQPVELPISDPLAGVMGATNAITYTSKLMGNVTLIGPGAGRIETGYALLNDILTISTAK